MSSIVRNETIEQLKKVISPILEEQGIELVELNFVKSAARPILKLLVDRMEGGINLDECARLNRLIGDVLDTQGIIKDRYILEVSSPGLDRPLKTHNDFLRCINRRVRFFLSESVDGKTEFEGIVSKLEGDTVFVDSNGKFVEIQLSKINKAKQTLDNV